MSERKIIQIMPAADWGAAYNDHGDELMAPLVCWALVQDADGLSSVVGLTASGKQVTFCDTDETFTGYLHLDDLLDDPDLLMAFDDEEDDDEGLSGPPRTRLN